MNEKRGWGSWFSLAMGATLAFGCAGAASGPPSGRTPSGGSVVAKPVRGSEGERCVESPDDGKSKERKQGVEALLANDPARAISLFDAAAAAHPGDPATQALRIASSALLLSANASAEADLETADVPVAPPLPLSATFRRAAPVSSSGALRIEKVSASKNLITDSEAWFQKNGLSEVDVRPRADQIPPFVAAKFQGQPVRELFIHGDHTIGLYRETAAVFSPGKKPRAIDLSRLARTQGGVSLEIEFAQVVGTTMLVQLWHNGYARDVGGKNGFVAAISLGSATDAKQAAGDLLWVSEPLVGNAHSFVVAGSHLVVGYGFTAEPDALFVIDVATGKTEQKEPVPNGPEAILRKGDQLFVRTYDTDLVYRMTPSAPAAPPATLEGAAGAGQASIDPRTLCLVVRALAEIDRRDPQALDRTVTELQPLRGDDPLVRALAGTQRFLAERARHPGIDLGAQPIVVAETPPWDYVMRGSTPATKRSPRLVKVSSAPADPVRGVRGPAVVDPTKPVFIPPVARGKLPAGTRTDIPTQFGVDDLRAVIPSGDRTILVYGGRYVAIVHGTTVEHVVDFEAYRHPPRANPQWAEFAVEDVTFAQIDGSTLYVANGGGSYAREVFGKKGFMSAIDLATGKLVWRSQPLVNDATFALIDGLVATGYGFTDEEDWLYLLDAVSGKVLTKARLDTGPQEVTASGRRIHVEAYSNRYDFELAD